MKYIRAIFIAFLIFGMFAIFAVNNLWRLMPTFHSLDTFFIIPLYIQILFLSLSFILSFSFLIRRNCQVKIILIFIVFLSIFLMSEYKVLISNSQNSMKIGIEPFFINEIRLSSIESIDISDNEISINTKVNSFDIIIADYLFSIDGILLKERLTNNESCITEDKGKCKKYDFYFP